MNEKIVKRDLEPKKMLPVRILQILEQYTDENHKLTQKKIGDILKNNYDLEVERKAISRNILQLSNCGYDIVSDRNGTYLASREFEEGELTLLIDSVLSSRYISDKYTLDLIKKLENLGGQYFKSIKRHIVNLTDFQKENNAELFLNIEHISQSIDEKKQISFFYNEYGVDKKLHQKGDKKYVVNGYAFLHHNDRYYLVANIDKYDDIRYFRVDRITKVEILKNAAKPLSSIVGYEKGLNIGKMTNSLPYMFGNKIEDITFVTTYDQIGNAIDWFGKNIIIKEVVGGKVQITVKATERAMRFWILQFGKYVTLISPKSLLDTVKDDILEMCKNYGI